MTISKQDFIENGWPFWPALLCSLFGHLLRDEWTHPCSDGSCADLFPDGNICKCGKVIISYREASNG